MGKSLLALWVRSRAVRFASRAFLLLCCCLSPCRCMPTPGARFLLEAIVKPGQASHSDATLLLLTTDLGWYEQNMSRSAGDQGSGAAAACRVVGESARGRQVLGESYDVFLASGSCKAGRDIDLLYVSNNWQAKARSSIDAVGRPAAIPGQRRRR